jgi:hypothetical protein
VVVVVVVAGCSDAQELRIMPRTGSAKVKISLFMIWNSYHDKGNFTTFDALRAPAVLTYLIAISSVRPFLPLMKARYDSLRHSVDFFGG